MKSISRENNPYSQFRTHALKFKFKQKPRSTNLKLSNSGSPFNYVACIKLRNTTAHDILPVKEYPFLHCKTKNNKISMAHQLQPTITFILPVQNEQILMVEQINTCFKFSEQYPGLCEIIIVTDDFEDKSVYLLWLATKLNKVNHPHVRTRMIRYTSKLHVRELIETGIKHALGKKIVIATNNSGRIEQFQPENLNMVKGNILATPHLLNIDALKEALLKN